MVSKRQGILPGWVIPLLALLLCGYLFVKLVSYQVAISSKQQELASVKEQLTSQLAANDELQRYLDAGEDAIIEGAAREAGYARPNERIFIDISGK